MLPAEICPFCGSPRFRLQEGMLRVRIVAVADKGPGKERAFLVYRCLTCGQRPRIPNIDDYRNGILPLSPGTAIYFASCFRVSADYRLSGHGINVHRLLGDVEE